jgi:N-sulfoglucosamine sulfohydrolase
MKNKMLFNRILISLFTIGIFSDSAISQTAKSPNIVVFIADDAGMDFGCYGNNSIKTPNIDKIAQQGVRFQNAFLTSPQSSPSRTSMMTGMFAHTIGTEDLHSPIDAKTKMLPSYFKEAGYFTGSMLKTHWGANGDKQFDRMISGGYLPKQGDLTEETFKNYEQFIEDSGNRPFFLWIGFIDPHRPYNRDICPQRNNPKETIIPPFLINGEDTRRDMADYYDEISRMDSHIGRMISYLKEKNILENTIIVFLSDNGKPFPRCKGTLYDSGIQTPLIFMWKNKIPENRIHSNGLISTIDLAATLLHFAGVKMDDKVYSKSFHNLLFNPSLRGREYIFSERNWHDSDEYMRCIRTEKFKLIYNAYYELPHGTATDLSTSLSWYELKKVQRAGKLKPIQSQIFAAPRPMVEVYDLKNDPNELDNVADISSYVEKTGYLSKLLIDWQKETKDHPWWKRRRPDQNDRITGFPMFPKREEFWTD